MICSGSGLVEGSKVATRCNDAVIKVKSFLSFFGHRPGRLPRFIITWNLKHLFIDGCFNWMIPNHYIVNGCFTKHPFKIGCSGYQVLIFINFLISILRKCYSNMKNGVFQVMRNTYRVCIEMIWGSKRSHNLSHELSPEHFSESGSGSEVWYSSYWTKQFTGLPKKNHCHERLQAAAFAKYILQFLFKYTTWKVDGVTPCIGLSWRLTKLFFWHTAHRMLSSITKLPDFWQRLADR